jgi:hypothetical protein
MGLTAFPDGISNRGTAVTYGVASVVDGAGTVTPTAPTVSAPYTTTTLSGFVAALNVAHGGTANGSPASLGGSVASSTIVFGIRDHAGGTVGGTASVGYQAIWTIS